MRCFKDFCIKCAQNRNSRPFRLCTSPASILMTAVFGLGMKLRVCMRTKLENGVLSNKQQTQSVVNGFVDQGEFEAMKMLSCWEAAHCDEYLFYAKIKVSVRTV